jgi:prepilin-type N-terminal cleavage/methylation domain-containing protein
MSKRQGLTLIELLVVIAIVAIFIGLLLPAVERVRTAAARVQCQNNMKQVAIALANYSDKHEGLLPAGTIVDSAAEPKQRLSFLVHLLPYLEQEGVYKKIDRKQGWDAPDNQLAAATPLRVFVCPAAPSTPKNEAYYVGVTGVGGDSATLPADHPRAGAFSYDQPRKAKDAATTLVMLETQSDNCPWAAGGSPTLRFLPRGEPKPIAADGAFGAMHHESRWGKVSAAANALFADGTVRTLNADTAPEVLAAMACLTGRAPPSPDE